MGGVLTRMPKQYYSRLRIHGWEAEQGRRGEVGLNARPTLRARVWCSIAVGSRVPTGGKPEHCAPRMGSQSCSPLYVCLKLCVVEAEAAAFWHGLHGRFPWEVGACSLT
jgi:hypothetical protein